MVGSRDALEREQLLQPGVHDEPGDPASTSWLDVAGVGQVLRRERGPALLCSPAPISAEMQRTMPAFWAFDARGWAASLRVPCLVLAGTDDPVAPLAKVRAVHDAIASSRFLAIEGGGHVPTTREPAAIAVATRKFLAGLG